MYSGDVKTLVEVVVYFFVLINFKNIVVYCVSVILSKLTLIKGIYVNLQRIE